MVIDLGRGFSDSGAPARGDVVVQVVAVGLNRIDLLQRRGTGVAADFTLPHIPGMVLGRAHPWRSAAEVDAARVGRASGREPRDHLRESGPACAAGTDGLCPGKNVCRRQHRGGYARAVAPSRRHHGWSSQTTSTSSKRRTLPPPPTPAPWQSLFVTGQLTIGETLLVHAASRQVVTIAAVQLATRAGARVIVTARTRPPTWSTRWLTARTRNQHHDHGRRRGDLRAHRGAWGRHRVRPPRSGAVRVVDPGAASRGSAGLLRHDDR